MLLPGMLKWFAEGGEGQRRRRFPAGAEAQRQRGSTGQFADQRDVAGTGYVELPGQCSVGGKVLPTVAVTDIADGSPQEPFGASHDEMNVFALGMKQFVAADFGTPAGVAGAITRNVGSQ